MSVCRLAGWLVHVFICALCGERWEEIMDMHVEFDFTWDADIPNGAVLQIQPELIKMLDKLEAELQNCQIVVTKNE